MSVRGKRFFFSLPEKCDFATFLCSARRQMYYRGHVVYGGWLLFFPRTLFRHDTASGAYEFRFRIVYFFFCFFTPPLNAIHMCIRVWYFKRFLKRLHNYCCLKTFFSTRSAVVQTPYGRDSNNVRTFRTTGTTTTQDRPPPQGWTTYRFNTDCSPDLTLPTTRTDFEQTSRLRQAWRRLPHFIFIFSIRLSIFRIF